MSDTQREFDILPEAEKEKLGERLRQQVRCPMLELKDGIVQPDMETPQCNGKPDSDPPDSLKPYFESFQFGSVKVCEWHAQRLREKEKLYLDSFRIAFGYGLIRVQKMFLEVRCWNPVPLQPNRNE